MGKSQSDFLLYRVHLARNLFAFLFETRGWVCLLFLLDDAILANEILVIIATTQLLQSLSCLGSDTTTDIGDGSVDAEYFVVIFW